MATTTLVAELTDAGEIVGPPAPGDVGTNLGPASQLKTPMPVARIRSATPFRVETPFAHDWSAEKSTATAGWLVVLDVDARYVQPRQTAEPVLYAGNVPVQRLNVGVRTGRVIAVIPATRTAENQTRADLMATPIFFGAPELPERITRDMADAELARARAAGITADNAGRIRAAIRAGGPEVVVQDRAALLREAASLVLEHAPDESHLADIWTMEVTVPADR